MHKRPSSERLKILYNELMAVLGEVRKNNVDPREAYSLMEQMKAEMNQMIVRYKVKYRDL